MMDSIPGPATFVPEPEKILSVRVVPPNSPAFFEDQTTFYPDFFTPVKGLTNFSELPFPLFYGGLVPML